MTNKPGWLPIADPDNGDLNPCDGDISIVWNGLKWYRARFEVEAEGTAPAGWYTVDNWGAPDEFIEPQPTHCLDPFSAGGYL